MNLFFCLTLLAICVTSCYTTAKFVDIHIALKLDPGQFEHAATTLRYISDPTSSMYGKYLDQTQIRKLSQVNPTKISRMLKWFESMGIHDYKFYGDTFKVTLNSARVDNGLLTVDDLSAKLSKIDELRSIVAFIDGPPMRLRKITRRKAKRASENVDPGYVTKEVIDRIYNASLSTTVNRNITSMGVMEFAGAGGFSETDLMQAQVGNGVSKNPVPSNHILGMEWFVPDTESQLDIGVNWWAAPNASLWYEIYNGWIFGWAADFVNRDTIPDVVSLSWGWNEHDQCGIGNCTYNSSRVYVERTNYELIKMGLRGVTVVVSSGDAGSPGRTNEVCENGTNNHINAVFPGGSPWVTSVGGTYLVKTGNGIDQKWSTPVCQFDLQCATSNQEAVTTYSQTQWTSGSGFTAWDTTPWWQLNEVNRFVKYAHEHNELPKSRYWNKGGRAYPDVVAVGHNCAIYDGFEGGWAGVDGTSCSAPVFAGVIARLNDHQVSRGKPRLGFANPLLYEMMRKMPETFNMVTQGISSCTETGCCGPEFGFRATKLPWDVVKGLGSANIGKMVEFLDAHFSQ